MWNVLKSQFFMIWELPQNILGLFVWLAMSRDVTKKTFTMPADSEHTLYDFRYCPWKLRSGLSLSLWIFAPADADANKLLHEYGHSIQSMYLGPFYLIIIGIPSFIWACLYKIPAISKRWSYYDFYTEKWADHNGGVTR